MTPDQYTVLHLTGVILLFTGFGSLLGSDAKMRRLGGMLHGIGLLILLVAGFGFIAKSKPAVVISYSSAFVLVKLGIWLALGFLPVLAKRKVLAPGVVMLIAVALGACAAYIGHLKVLSLQ